MNQSKTKSKTKTTAKPASPTSRTFGESLIAGFAEFRDALAAGEPLEKRFRVRTIKLDIQPARQYSGADIKAAREKLNASQALLAAFLGVSTHTVSQWEQGQRKPPLMACRYLDDIQEFPELWTKRLTMAKATSKE